MTWTSYHPDGRPESIFYGSEPITEELEGLNYIAGEATETDYIDAGIITTRPSLNIFFSDTTIQTNQTLTVIGIPAGTLVSWSGGLMAVNDGEIMWSAIHPCTEKFTFSLWPYLDFIQNVTVTD